MMKSLFRQRTDRPPSRRFGIWFGVSLLVGLIVLSFRVDAGPLSTTPSKVTVYQGLISIVPITNTILEIGNNGSDIATNRNILFKPGGGGSLVIGPQTASTEGAEIVFNPASVIYSTWHLDTLGEYLRFFVVPPNQPGQEKFTLGSSGDAHVIGKLCLGFGTTDFNGSAGSCIDSWADLGGSGTSSGNLEDVLLRGNGSNQPITVAVSPGLGSGAVYQGATGLFEATNAAGYQSPTTSAIYAAAGEVLGAGSAIYAENPNGYAGYFSGRVAFQTASNFSPWSSHTMALRINGPVDGANGYPLEVYNANSLGLAAKFTGAVDVVSTSEAPNSRAVTVSNTRTGGTTVRASSPTTSGSAVYALGNAFNQDTVGLRAIVGTGSSYAAFFRGHVGVEGYVRFDSGQPGLQVNNSPRQKNKTELQVCPIASDTCLGRFIYTSSATPPARTSATQYCYELTNDYTTTCVSVYSGAPVTQQYELR